ncbi:hypothetical protein CANARDRAFT_122218 [[Candida] arabinofermentans NRRL YB-2248]|uniref:t-SNARE coiled-coil homology domain-containing protein n=1 Tax=[Candida] arabinofermentans NRRL YB-2248 TaxID=983967 RepID=A0A1E4ST89_9ASCO|nr:hypothetical protein CANARDRAFT_122218 [[Candida] arabinofermentans NRRL YB-2248]
MSYTRSSPYVTNFEEDPFTDPFDQPSQYASNQRHEMSDLFYYQSSKILELIKTYEIKISELENLQLKQLNTIGDEAQSQVLKEVERKTIDIRTIQMDIKSSIEELKSNCDRTDRDKVFQINNLNRNFRNLIEKFSKTQTIYKSKLNDQAVSQYQVVNPDASYDEAREFVENFGGQQVFQNALDQARSQEAIGVLNNVKSRYTEIQKIESLARELNDLTNTLQDLVVEQDIQFDSINQNVDVAQTQLERGDANIVKAVEHAKSARKKKWILIAILAVIIIAIVVGLVVKFVH